MIPRDDYYGEVVTLADIIDGGEPFIADKRFRRCIITDNVFLKVGTGNRLLFCYTPSHPTARFITLNDSRLPAGTILLIDSKFDECLFRRAKFVGTAQDAATMLPAFTIMSEAEWRHQYRVEG